MQHTVDLTNCEKEPIHIPGKIQQHGFLLAVYEHNLVIAQASDNLAAFTGRAVHDVIGQSVYDIIPQQKMQFILELLRKGDSETLNPLHVHIASEHGSVRYNCIVNKAPGLLLMEFEPAPTESADAEHVFRLLGDINARLYKTTSTAELCRTVCSDVRSYTGYDRVMLYKFDADWNGEVVAEDRAHSLHSFEGHHYPASDIPRQARELFFHNWIRIIPDVNYTPANIVPLNTASNEPLDLTYSVLRNVSPIHIQYLKNMDVGASLTISIIVGNKLWGMIACHHRTPMFVDFGKRKVCELIGRMFCSHLLFKEELEQAAYTKQIHEEETELAQQMHREMSIVNGIRNGDRRLLHITGAEGLVMNYRGKIYTLGTTPTSEQVDRLYHWLNKQLFSDIYYTNSLQQQCPDAAEFTDTASGILVISLSRSSEEYAIWFRPELVQTIRWAGNPDKAASLDETTLQLSPRKSFEVWKQEVYGKSASWKKSEVENAMRLHLHIQEVLLREYRQIGRSADTGRNQSREVEIKVLEQTIELRRRQQQLQAKLEESQQREQRMHYIQLINNGMIHLLRNRLANMSLNMSHSVAKMLGATKSEISSAEHTERAMRLLLEYSQKFTDLSLMEYSLHNQNNKTYDTRTA